MRKESLEDLFINELRELYDAERRCMKLLPKMAESATSTDLKIAFIGHAEETKEHVARLDAIFAQMAKRPQGRTSETMKDLVYDSHEAIEDYDGSVRDAALIATAQRIEHFEIAGYNIVLRFAQQLGNEFSAKLLEDTLTEEKGADETLSQIAEAHVDPQALAVALEPEWS